MMDFKIDPRMLASNATKPVVDQKAKDLESLRESSREFETIFVMEMFKAMRQATPEGGLFEKGMATDMFTEMLDMETAREATKGEGLGLGEAMYRQMASLIENKR